MSESHEHTCGAEPDLDEACRLLDGAMNLLERMAQDPRSTRERAAISLIDEMRAWGASAAVRLGGRESRAS